MVSFSKPGVSVPGYPAIDGIADRAGNPFEPIGQGPGETEPSRRFKHCIRMSKQAAVGNQYYAVECGPLEAGFSKKLDPSLGLEGCKAQDGPAVVAQQELYGAVAQVTDPVKKQDRAFDCVGVRRCVCHGGITQDRVFC